MKTSNRDVLMELKHAIMGNGTKGISERVTEMEKKLEALTKQVEMYKYLFVGAGISIGFFIEKILKFL